MYLAIFKINSHKFSVHRHICSFFPPPARINLVVISKGFSTGALMPLQMTSSSFLSIKIFLPIFLIIALQLKFVVPYASYMTTSSYCSLPLSVGSSIMGRQAIFSQQYGLTVTRGSNVILSSGSKYYPSEILTITFPVSSPIQFVIQATGGAIFTGSSFIGCSGTRIHDTQSVQLTMPNTASGNITLIAGWSGSYGLVSISPAVTLTPSKQTLRPVTRVPSTRPAVNLVTPGSSSSSSSSSSLSTQTINLLIGIIVGVGGFISLGILGFLYFRRGGKLPSFKLSFLSTTTPSASSIQPNVPRKLCNMSFISNTTLLSAVPSALSLVSGAVCLILVCLWATNGNSTTQTGYIGSPDWSNNPLAYHATFLVGGFFLSQLIAILVWTNVPTGYSLAKPVHAIIHTLGAGSLIVGLFEVVKYVNSFPNPALTTMHSWIGVMAVATYGTTYLLGASLALLKWFQPNHSMLSVVDWKAVHRSLGLSGVALTSAAILTGIMDYLPQGSCYYNNINSPYVDFNPAKNYGAMPTACKLANGLGASAVIAVIFLFIALMNRHKYKLDKVEPPVNEGLITTKDASTSADPTLEDVYSGSSAPTAP